MHQLEESFHEDIHYVCVYLTVCVCVCVSVCEKLRYFSPKCFYMSAITETCS